MISDLFTRRSFSLRLATFFSGLGIAGSAFGTSGLATSAGLAEKDEVSHNSEAIHQEVEFKASRKRVYEALLDAKFFERAKQLAKIPGGAPTEVSRELGGTFSIFGGHIVGRSLELVLHERIVQAWRVVDWDPGAYSIAKFELKELGAGARLIFDHTGFPAGKGEHLADGWNSHYWASLQKYLA